MTELLEKAVDGLRALPPEQQDEIARFLLEWNGDRQPEVVLTPEEEASMGVSLAQAEHGEFVPEAAMAEFWARYKL